MNLSFTSIFILLEILNQTKQSSECCSVFLCPVFEDFLLGVGQLNGRVDQIRVPPEKLPLPLLEFFAGSELLADAERLGEDAVRRDFHVRREEGVPVQVRHAAALCAQHVVHRPDQQREVVRPDRKSTRLNSVQMYICDWS